MSGLAQLFRHSFRALFALCCLAAPLHAQTLPRQATDPFRLVWSSSAGCGDAQGFSSELKGRTEVLRDAERDEHAITFIVETFPDGAQVRGQLTVRNPDGELSVREVPGANCEEVESAMALIAALMVDPLAAGPSAQSRPRRNRASLGKVRAAAPAKARWSLRVEHRFIAQGAVAPHPSWGQAGRLLVSRGSKRLHSSVSLAGHFTRATSSGEQGSAELEWAAAQLSLCPVGFQPSSRWDLQACAALQVGRLRGVGFGTEAPASRSILWSGAGPVVEARFQLLGPLWAGVESGLTFPFTRERFFFEPNDTLHRVPPWGVSWGLGLGLRFF